MRIVCQRGFTLLEALVVLALIAVLATMSIPALGTMLREYRLNAETREVLAAMTVARMKATSSNFNYTFSFDTVTNRYQVSGAEPAAPDGKWYPWYDANSNGVRDTDFVYADGGVKLRDSFFQLAGVPNPLPSLQDPSAVTATTLNITYTPDGFLINTADAERCVVLQNKTGQMESVCAEPGGITRVYRADSGNWKRIY